MNFSDKAKLVERTVLFLGLKCWGITARKPALRDVCRAGFFLRWCSTWAADECLCQRSEVLILRLGIETGTGFFHPGEVAMTEYLGLRVVGLQTAQQVIHRSLLGWGTGVGGMALFVESSLVADADGVGIVVAGVGTGLFFGTTEVELSIAGDVEVVADAVEATTAVAGFQVVDTEMAVAACG